MIASPQPDLRRILVAIETSGPGGAEHMVLRLACALRERGLEPCLATMSAGWLTERAERAELEVWIEPQRDGPDPFWVGRIARRCRRERVQLVHAHEFEMNAYGGAAAALARIPSLATVHGSIWGVEAGRHRFAYRALARVGQRVVAVSHQLADRLRERLGPRCPIDVVHNGIPLPPQLPVEDRARARGEARRALGIPPEGPLLVAVGNLYPVKDHASLLRATATLTDAHVAVAGRGEEESNLKRLAGELGIQNRVHLLGLRDDVGEIMRAADVFVHPSLDEGLPLAILEAMGAELPIVASNVGGIGEAVVDGESGLLVPERDPDRLADAIRRLLAEPRRAEALASAARQRAEAEFSVERMAERYEGLYAELAA